MRITSHTPLLGTQSSRYFFFERDHVNAAYKPTSQSYGTLAAANALFDEWIYKNPAGRIDYFKKINGVYKLVSSHTKEGVGQFFTYDANARLQSISDSFGRELQITWKNVYVIESIVGPELSLHYEYELADNPSGTPVVGTERLHKVLVKDANGAVLTTREYHYEDPNSRFFLTGITDENSNRYATYAYNQNGQVVSSEHAGGTDRNIYSYSGDTGRTITDPLGTARTFSLINLGGYGRVTSIAQPGGSGCGPGASSFTYDENRNVSSSTDFNGNKTCFAFDASRSLETGRIEGVGAGAACPTSPVARTQSCKQQLTSTTR